MTPPKLFNSSVIAAGSPANDVAREIAQGAINGVVGSTCISVAAASMIFGGWRLTTPPSPSMAVDTGVAFGLCLLSMKGAQQAQHIRFNSLRPQSPRPLARRTAYTGSIISVFAGLTLAASAAFSPATANSAPEPAIQRPGPYIQTHPLSDTDPCRGIRMEEVEGKKYFYVPPGCKMT